MSILARVSHFSNFGYVQRYWNPKVENGFFPHFASKIPIEMVIEFEQSERNRLERQLGLIIPKGMEIIARCSRFPIACLAIRMG